MESDKKEIFDFLLKVDRESETNWKTYLLSLVNLADDCSKILIGIIILTECRRVEEENNDKRLSSYAMGNKVTEIIIRARKEQKFDKNADIFYSPVRLKNLATNEEFYFNDEIAILWLKKILFTDFIIPDDIANLRDCALSLKGAFHSLLNIENHVPIQVILRLDVILVNIAQKTKELQNDLLQKEIKRDQGKKSRVNIKQKNFEKLKKHLLPGMSERQVKTKIKEVLNCKDNKTLNDYLKMWRDYLGKRILTP